MKKFLEGCPFGCFFVCDVGAGIGDVGWRMRRVSIGEEGSVGVFWCFGGGEDV
jgi:hypothetical protein